MEATEHIALMAAAIHTYNGFGFDHSVMQMKQFPIDEVAILFADEAQLDEWLGFAEKDHMLRHDRTEHDTMHRNDTRRAQAWRVRFEFLQVTLHADAPTWRIEAMVVLGGRAPLHQAMLAATEGRPAIIHASYKLPGVDAYHEEVQRLMSNGMTMQAGYTNSYGVFSYWNSGDGAPVTNVYLKPRINLRDG